MSRSLKKAQKPSVALSKVPSVKGLCEQLGFQRASIKDTDTFMEATRAWRRSYKTSADLPGGHLLRWNDPAVQTELKAMSRKFLESGDNAERFWGASRDWYHPSDVQFPEERERIVDLLMQLFWKQNKYAFNNSQYGHKQSESMEASRDSSIAIDSIGGGKFIASNLSEMSGSAPTSPSKVSKVSLNNDSIIFSSQNRVVSEPNARRQPPDRDIFEGPDDLDGSIRGTERRVLDESAEHDNAHTGIKATFKRRRDDGIGPPSTHEDSTSLPSPVKKKKYHLADSPRRTDRRRVQRHIPSAVSGDEFEELLKEQEVAEILACEEADQRARLVDDKEGSLRNRPVSWGTGGLPKTPPSHASQPAKTFSAPTAPMTSSKKGKSPISLPKTSRTVHHTSSPSKARGKTQSNEVDSHPGLRKGEPRLNFASYLSRTSHHTSSIEGPSSGKCEVVVISPTGDEDLAFSKSSFFQRNEANRGQPLPSSKKATAKDPRPAPPREFIDPVSARSTEGGHEDNDINFQRTILDSIAQAHAGKVEIKPPEDLPERQDMEYQEKDVDNMTTEFTGVKTHTETPLPQLSTENIDAKSTADPTPQSTLKVPTQPQPAPQSQLPPQPNPSPQATPTDSSSSKPRPKTQIPLWIITREPRYTEERWDDGKFSGTPLSAFIAGISQVTQRQHIEKIKLTLRTPMSDTKITVSKDAEDSWVSAKETFVEKLKEARLEARSRRQNESLSCKILVEPFYEQNMLPSGSVDEDDEEFEF